MNTTTTQSTVHTKNTDPTHFLRDLTDKTILVLGLGLHGGGVATTQYLARQKPKKLIVMDNGDRQKLNPSLQKLKEYDISYCLGSQDPDIISHADLVVKNPAVHHQNPILKKAKHITTDIALFMKDYEGSILAITGSKGKSSLTQALGKLMNMPSCGNNTHSPLELLMNDEALPPQIILELSSFQIGDLSRYAPHFLSRCSTCILTNIYKDHMDYYSDFDLYLADKHPLFSQCNKDCKLIMPSTSLGREWARGHKAEKVYFHGLPWAAETQGAYIRNKVLYQKSMHGTAIKVLNHDLAPLQNIHPQNLEALTASCLAHQKQLPPTIKELENYFSLPYRKEKIAAINGRSIINDSAATIPEAMNLNNYQKLSLIVICGGTDKALVAQATLDQLKDCKALVLFDGSFTKKILPLLDQSRIKYHGPYTKLAHCLDAALKESASGDTIIFSPGCASFESFSNANERGKQFTAVVQDQLAQSQLTA